MTTTLKPCLRCGGALALHGNDWSDPPTWSWRCPSCALTGREFLTEVDAITDANARPLRWTLMRVCRLAVVLGLALAGLLFIVLVSLPGGGT
ncbi:MAG: hypothetical protein ACK4JB_20100 [Reyranella sp.]